MGGGRERSGRTGPQIELIGDALPQHLGRADDLLGRVEVGGQGRVHRRERVSRRGKELMLREGLQDVDLWVVRLIRCEPRFSAKRGNGRVSVGT